MTKMLPPPGSQPPLPLLVLRRGVVMPGSVVSLPVGRRRSVALAATVSEGSFVLIATQRDASVEDPSYEELHPMAVLCRVRRKSRRKASYLTLTVEGIERRYLAGVKHEEPFQWAYSDLCVEINGDTSKAAALAESLRGLMLELDLGRRMTSIAGQDWGPSQLADAVCAILDIEEHELDKIELLHETCVESRLRRCIAVLGKSRAEEELKREIDDDIRRDLTKAQRDAILREQLRAIRKKLGHGSGDKENLLLQRLESLVLDDLSRETIDREIARMEGGGNSPDAQVARKYLELVADLPWHERVSNDHDLYTVEDVLNAEHEGLEEAKKRILEHMAVMQLGGKAKGTVLCLAGPPGVGKTSLAQSVANATGRPLHRISLGGIRDEAEIRGHRRTYVGAMPGRLINAMRKVKVKNPVFVLDEIDKMMSGGHSGDPEAALLEVLDPEQNHNFCDHYLEIPFDLSEVLFIATANDIGRISGPLRDRLEIIEVSGYTTSEKIEIGKNHLLPKELNKHGLESDDVEIDEDIWEPMITGYTREAGVRQLTRVLAKLCRHQALIMARAQDEETYEVLQVDRDVMIEVLGVPKVEPDKAEDDRPAGIAAGLAWTPVGGDILYIETTQMPGKGKVQITGRLGETMTESVHTALSYLRTHADTINIDPEFLESIDIHVHVPAGAVPKDGPSAGVTLYTALTSLITGRKVRSDVAMTGEASLRGKVLPVGGIKSKLLAAHRAGFKRILLPKQNEKDLQELPDEVREDLEIIPVETMSEVLALALD